jgi:hypothetical protein
LFFPLLLPLVSPLRVIPLDVHLQMVGLYEAGFAVLCGAPVRTVVIVEHCVPLQIIPLGESGTASRDGTLEWSLARVSSLMLRGVGRRG